MSHICDICKIRPATARVTFVRDGQSKVIDICREDYLRLQAESPLAELIDGDPFAGDMGSGEPLDISEHLAESTKVVLQRAADTAGSYGHIEMRGEHLLISLIQDRSIKKLLAQYKIKVADIAGYIEANVVREGKHPERIAISEVMSQVVMLSREISQELNSELILPQHLFIALIQKDDGLAGSLLRRYGLTPEMIRQTVVHTGTDTKTGTPQLDRFTRDISALAKNMALDPVIGRATEIESTIEILSRRTKNNPVLIGEPGVGKTAIVEGLAQRIAEGSVPTRLHNKRVLELSLNSLVAGTRYRGEFEERMKAILDEIRRHSDELIIFIDELHTIVGSGGGEGGLDAANVIKPSLARGELHLIGATTLNEYQKYIEKDSALERRFQPITVSEPSKSEAVAIIKGLKPKYEEYHKISISDEAIDSAVTLSDRYITSRFLPDKAIDLIDQAAARVAIKAETEKAVSTVTQEDIAVLIAKLTGVPVTQLTEVERKRLVNLEGHLAQRVVGQDQAVSAVAHAVRLSRAGLTDEGRPIATFLFLGPTGVGKTELAKALAASMFGDESLLTRIDMSEYMERHAVSRLIGSPPGYVGYEEGGQLTEAVRRHPYSVILLDEIEKAHPEVANILLQLLDEGRLTDGKGRVVNFTNTIIIATSNIGSQFYNRPPQIGFSASEDEDSADSAQRERIMEEVGGHFRPEFINRLDDVIIFHQLGENEIKRIVGLQLDRVKASAAAQQITLKIAPSLVAHFMEAGFKPEYGARELKRTIKQQLENVLALKMLDGTFPSGSTVKASYAEGKGVVLA